MLPDVIVQKTLPGGTAIAGPYHDISTYVNKVKVTHVFNAPSTCELELLNKSDDYPSSVPNTPFAIGGPDEFRSENWVKVWLLPQGTSPMWDNITFYGQLSRQGFAHSSFDNKTLVNFLSPLQYLKMTPVACHTSAMYDRLYNVRQLLLGGVRLFGLGANLWGSYIDGIMRDATETWAIYCEDSIGGLKTVSLDLISTELPQYKVSASQSTYSVLNAMAERLDLQFDVVYNPLTSHFNLIVKPAKTIIDAIDHTIHWQRVFSTSLNVVQEMLVSGVIVYGNEDDGIVGAYGDVLSAPGKFVQTYEDRTIASFQEALLTAKTKKLKADEGEWEGNARIDPLWNTGIYTTWQIRPGHIVNYQDSVNGINRNFRVHQVTHEYAAGNLNTPKWLITVEPTPGAYKTEKLIGKVIVEYDRKIARSSASCSQLINESKPVTESGAVYQGGDPALNYTDGNLEGSWP